MCLAASADAIRHAFSTPRAPCRGNTTTATTVATTVDIVASTKHRSTGPVCRTTRRMSAVKRSIGTATGNRIEYTAEYVLGLELDMMPIFEKTSAISVDTRGPESCLPTAVSSDHIPSAAAMLKQQLVPHTSLPAMSGRLNALLLTTQRSTRSSGWHRSRRCFWSAALLYWRMYRCGIVSFLFELYIARREHPRTR